MAVNEVCRLCLSTENLLWIFDKENTKLKMKDIVFITTGIEIHLKDIISQKICEKCLEYSIQIFQFRGQCIKADKYLKDMCISYLIDKKYYIPNTDVTIVKNEVSKPKPVTKHNSIYTIHPSIMKLSKTYPDIKLPRNCLSSNITPCVVMELDQVENCFKRLNLDFNQCAKNALLSTKSSLDLVETTTKQMSDKEKSVTRTLDVDKVDKDNNKEKSNAKVLCTSTKRRSRSPNVKRKLIESDHALINSSKGESESVAKDRKKRKLNFIEKSTNNNSNIDLGEENAKNTSTSKKKPIVSAENPAIEKHTNKTQSVDSPVPTLDITESPTKRKRKQVLIDNFLKKKNSDHDSTESKKTHSKTAQPNRGCLKKESATNLKTTNDTISSDNCANSVTDLLVIRKEKLVKSESVVSSKSEVLHESADGKSVASRFDESVDNDSLTSVGRSIPLYVCDICNSVQYNMFELKRHKTKHMRCQFCGARFRSLENKMHHVENVCIMKKIMTDLPNVNLTRIDYDSQLRIKYSSAFAALPDAEEIEVVSARDIWFKKSLFKDFPQERLDIIEILSDDDAIPNSDNEAEHPIVPDITIDDKVFSNMRLKTADRAVLRNLVDKLLRPSKSVETGIQTDLPTNSEISVTENCKARLKNLLPFLSMYKIPVKFQPGNFNPSYDYDVKPNLPKVMCLWDDLTPTNLKLNGEDCSSLEVVNFMEDTNIESSNQVAN